MAKRPRKPKAAETLVETGGEAPPVTVTGDFNGADPEKFDHDGDGAPGGSKPKKLGEHEFAAICAEAYEAYDFQGERIRFDTLGRRWTFRPEKVGAGHSVLWLQVSRLTVAHEDTISTALLASDLGRDMVADVVGKLAAQLA